MEMKKQAREAPPLPAALQDAIQWALYSAGVLGFAFAFTAVCTLTSLDRPLSRLLPRAAAEMTDAEATAVDALMTGMRCCCALQVVARTLALKLPCLSRRVRLWLAYAALVATVASHGMWAAVNHLFVAAHPGPGGLFFGIAVYTVIFAFAVGDLRCLLSLLRLRGGEE